ncbi:MAG: hypothetical protein M3P06_06675 [Acidobacteriota bacterium]|nr:hypothetical protein [Acidobacteriota bacterium]
MSLIDWSDPEEMLGLLVEFVADEAVASQGDVDRARFLTELSRALAGITEHDVGSVHRIELELREIHDAQPREFARDPVMAHVEACIEELHRIATDNLRGEPTRSNAAGRSSF